MKEQAAKVRQRRSGRRGLEEEEDAPAPTHSLTVNLLAFPTTVAMAMGSRGNRLCQALTEMLARGVWLYSDSTFYI